MRSRIVNLSVKCEATQFILLSSQYCTVVLQKATYALQIFSHWFVILTPSLSLILQFSEAELSEESITQRAKRQTYSVSRGSIN